MFFICCHFAIYFQIYFGVLKIILKMKIKMMKIFFHISLFFLRRKGILET